MATVAVTGGTGYIGRHLVAGLVSAGTRPRCLVRAASRADVLPHGAVDLVQGDITARPSLPAFLEGVTTVIHCASVVANVKQRSGLSYRQINVNGTQNLVLAAKEAGVRHFIHLGGLNTVAGGLGSYMRTRFDAERAVREGGVPYTILQPSILFGDGAAFFTALAGLARMAPIIPVPGNGKMRFQPISVHDVVRCLTQLLAEGGKGETIPIGGPAYYSYDELLDLICTTIGKRRLKLHFPMPLMRLSAAGMQLILPRPPVTTATLELFSLGQDNITALDAVSARFGFQSKSLEEDLRLNGL